MSMGMTNNQATKISCCLIFSAIVYLYVVIFFKYGFFKNLLQFILNLNFGWIYFKYGFWLQLFQIMVAFFSNLVTIYFKLGFWLHFFQSWL
jgi:hypothetical protein